MEVEHWNAALGELNEANIRRYLERGGYVVARYDYAPGTSFSDHTHDYDKKDAVLAGSFGIRSEGREFLLGPGDMLSIKAGTVHNAEVVGDETVISLDASRY